MTSPGASSRRSATSGGHFREAQAQYLALGDRLTEWNEFPYVPLEELKQIRKHNEEILLGGRTPIGLPGWHFIGSKNNDGHWRVNFPVEAVGKQEAASSVPGTQRLACTTDGISYVIRVQPVPPALRNQRPDASWMRHAR